MSRVSPFIQRTIRHLANYIFAPVYNRINIIDQKLNEITHQISTNCDAISHQNTSIAKTQTALLEALIHQVNVAQQTLGTARELFSAYEASSGHLVELLDALTEQTRGFSSNSTAEIRQLQDSIIILASEVKEGHRGSYSGTNSNS
jgi:methyl-accepting chemotaxis protein